MNPLQLVLILRARYKIALFALLGTIAVTLVVSLLLPKQYTATVPRHGVVLVKIGKPKA